MTKLVKLKKNNELKHLQKVVMNSVYSVLTSPFFVPLMLVGISLMMIALFPFHVAHAQEVAAPVDASVPSWLGVVIQFISALPYVGPYVVLVLKYVGLIASVMTALSVCAQVLLAIPEIIARFSKAPEIANKIKAFSDAVLPILKYLSVFNVQKKQ